MVVVSGIARLLVITLDTLDTVREPVIRRAPNQHCGFSAYLAPWIHDRRGRASRTRSGILDRVLLRGRTPTPYVFLRAMNRIHPRWCLEGPMAQLRDAYPRGEESGNDRVNPSNHT